MNPESSNFYLMVKLKIIKTLNIDHKKMKSKRSPQIVGGLSNPGKMPCPGWSIPAIHCITAQSLD